MNIRQASKEDILSLAILFNAYLDFYHVKDGQERSTAFLQDRLERGDSVIFVVEEETEVVGFAQLYPSFSSLRMKKSWILNDLFINPKVRRKGYATKLMDVIENFSRDSEAKGLVLSTGMENESAHRLYEKRGWKKDTMFFHYFLNH